MFMFPLPFLTACLLAVLLAHSLVLRRLHLPPLAMFALAGYAVQAVLIGVKWGFHELRPLPVIVFASLLPLLTWAALCDLTGGLTCAGRRLTLGAAACLVAVVLLLDQAGPAEGLDLLSTAQYVTFGALLLMQAVRSKPRWSGDMAAVLPVSAQAAFLLGGALLFGSAAIDIAFLTRMALNHGHVASVVVGYGNFVAAMIAMAIFFRGLHDRAEAECLADGRCSADPQDTGGADQARTLEILARLEALMQNSHLYRVENLTLQRLASHIDVPARQISTAVRTARQMGVPQYVNSFRVADACRMLSETELPVTEIVFAVGFTTKSSFNREFSRSYGVSPSVWRACNRRNTAAGRLPGAVQPSRMSGSPVPAGNRVKAEQLATSSLSAMTA